MIYLLSHTIDNSAERSPEQEAFRFEGKSLTYAELVKKANSLANLLKEQGIQRGERVGIYLNKSLESAIALYGIIKAGAAYVPLDPTAPATRIGFILNNCGIRCLITQPQKRSRVREILAESTPLEFIIGLAEETELPVTNFSWSTLETISGEFPPKIKILEQDLAYIMYTSGSTGEPKGIAHTHHSGLTYAQMGATTVIIPEAYTKLPASLSQLIEEEKLTIWYSVPYALIQLFERGLLTTRNLTSLRWILFGGEPFPPKYLYELMQLLPQARFSNVYGPAEINQCTYYHIPPLKAIPDEPVPIGQTWDIAEELVLDEQDRPVSPGEVGELLVRTPTMMQGYWQNPDLDQQAFFYRFWQNRQEVFYRTGDVVQLQPDGNYRFCGRKDRQIKTRGYRVELDEIEAALISHPQVEEAGVFSVPDREGTQHIEAAVTLKKENNLTEIELIRYAANCLPKYGLPRQIEIREELPRTTTGKIDRRALQQEALSKSINY